MQSWTTEMWQAALIGLVVGFVIGYFLLRLTKESAKKTSENRSGITRRKRTVGKSKTTIGETFFGKCDLLKSLAQDYQKLYQHLAQSSNRLLPELTDKALFQHNLLDDKGNPLPTNSDDQPKDYSEGSSGIFKAEK